MSRIVRTVIPSASRGLDEVLNRCCPEIEGSCDIPPRSCACVSQWTDHTVNSALCRKEYLPLAVLMASGYRLTILVLSAIKASAWCRDSKPFHAGGRPDRRDAHLNYQQRLQRL